MQDSLIKVYFTISGDFDPDIISKLLGIQADKTAKKGERDPSGGGLHINRKSMWYLTSGEIKTSELDEPLLDLVNKVYPVRSKISEVGKRTNIDIYFSCYVDIDDLAPSIYLSSELLSKVVDLGAYIEISQHLTSEYD